MVQRDDTSDRSESVCIEYDDSLDNRLGLNGVSSCFIASFYTSEFDAHA